MERRHAQQPRRAELAARVIELNEAIVNTLADLMGFVPARGRPSLETVSAAGWQSGRSSMCSATRGVAATKVRSLIESEAGLDQIACGPIAALGLGEERPA